MGRCPKQPSSDLTNLCSASPNIGWPKAATTLSVVSVTSLSPQCSTYELATGET